MRTTTWGTALVLALAATAGADPLDDLTTAAARSHAGDHTGAIELYERAYTKTADLDVLVLLGNEQRAAGKVDAALVSFCTYLSLEPQGDLVDDAKSQVVALNAVRGIQVDSGNVCAPPAQAQPSMPDLSVPAQRMLPGLTPPAERMLPPTGLPSMQPSKRMSRRELTGITLGAAGVASAAAGLYYGFQARSISDDIASHSPSEPWPVDIAAQEDRGQRAERLSSAFLLGGALAIGAGTYLYVSGRSERLSIAPTATQTGGGFVVAGGF